MNFKYKNMPEEKAKKVADYYLKNKDIFDKINLNEVETDFHPIKGIYIDIVLMKDFRMGLLLSLFSPDELLPNLRKWNIRPQRIWTKPYDNLGYTDEQFQEMYLDPKNHTTILNKSPDTVLMENVHDFIIMTLAQNVRSDYNHKIPLYLNTYPISPDNELMAKFLKYVTSTIPKEVVVHIICVPSKDIPKKCIAECDAFMLDDLLAHFEPEASLHEAMFTTNEMTSKNVLAVPQIADDKLPIFMENINIWAPNEMEDFLMPTALMMNAICSFSYSWFPIPMPDRSDPYPPPSSTPSEKTDIIGKFKKKMEEQPK